MADRTVSFYEDFGDEDNNTFIHFDEENLKKLYKKNTSQDIVVMPISTDLSATGNG